MILFHDSLKNTIFLLELAWYDDCIVAKFRAVSQISSNNESFVLDEKVQFLAPARRSWLKRVSMKQSIYRVHRRPTTTNTILVKILVMLVAYRLDIFHRTGQSSSLSCAAELDLLTQIMFLGNISLNFVLTVLLQNYNGFLVIFKSIIYVFKLQFPYWIRQLSDR